nr:protein ALP1-like [Tanacetum cinerariifolium]
MNFENLFFDDTDDEAEVNSLAALVIGASTPTIQKYQRNHIVRDRYGAHDRLVHAYFAKKPFYNDYLFRIIDCTKWLSAQCPQAYRAQFSRGDSGSVPFILLEAVASQDLWIWHAFFGVARSNNDVNVLHQSTVLNDLKVGKAPEVPFVANDVNYKWGYYLTDGIYPEWVVLMKSIAQLGSNDVKRIRYKQVHDAARKDVERAFGVLKKKMGYRKNSCTI